MALRNKDIRGQQVPVNKFQSDGLKFGIAGEHLVTAGDGGEMVLWKADMAQLNGDATHWSRSILRSESLLTQIRRTCVHTEAEQLQMDVRHFSSSVPTACSLMVSRGQILAAQIRNCVFMLAAPAEVDSTAIEHSAKKSSQ